MKLRSPIYAMLSIAISASAAMAQDYQTGLRDIKIIDADGDRHIDGYLWYPTRETDGVTQAHGNAVWESVGVIPDAEPAAGQKPLVVLSHGMFGNSRNQAWLAAALTAKGYIVAAVDHPGTSTFQRDPDHRRELWERPRDISRAIDHLIAMPDFGEMIDPDRIFMGGHSLGGFTAVALAGGRYDPDRVDADCKANSEDLVCSIFSAWGIAKTPEDRAEISGDLSDPRIAGFAVFDLGGTQTFSPESLSAIDKPMFVIGAPIANSGIDLNRESRALAQALPEVSVQYSEPANLAHFDFLGVCTEAALDILKEEEPEDVYVCEDGTEARRQEHNQIAREVAAFFGSI